MKSPHPQLDLKHVNFLLTAKGINVLSTGPMTFAEVEKLIRWIKKMREGK